MTNTAQNFKLIEDLESRQLEEEMRLHDEFDIEKRAVMVRLKHMEAYCQHLTPPPTPVDRETTSSPVSVDQQQQQLPSRKVTEKDYHSLAAQYRERDAMDSLHSSKINVLRGKQKKAVETFTFKREHEVELMERQHDKEVELMDEDVLKREEVVRTTFSARRAKLESRWKLQALIERNRQERLTGGEHVALPDVVAAEERHGEIERRHVPGANGSVIIPTVS